MTWAKNYGDRLSGAPASSGKRAKKIEKTCAKCGAGIERRKTFCRPCYSARLEANIAKNRHRYQKKGKPNGPANPI